MSSGSRTRLDLTDDRLQETEHLARNSHDDHHLGLSRGRQATITPAQPDLRLPDDIADGQRQGFNSIVQLEADAGRQPVAPGTLDQDRSAKMLPALVMQPRRTPTPLKCSEGTRSKGRDRPSTGGVSKAREVAHLSDHGDRREQSNAAHGPQDRHGRHHRPPRDQPPRFVESDVPHGPQRPLRCVNGSGAPPAEPGGRNALSSARVSRLGSSPRFPG